MTFFIVSSIIKMVLERDLYFVEETTSDSLLFNRN